MEKFSDRVLLIDHGDLQWPSVRQLLNQQKIYESFRGPFPEDELDKNYDSRRVQLKTSAKKARRRLMLIETGIFNNPL
jgi:hypothetical protein